MARRRGAAPRNPLEEMKMKTDRAWVRYGLGILAAAGLAAGCEWSSSIPDDEASPGDAAADDATAGDAAQTNNATSNGLFPR